VSWKTSKAPRKTKVSGGTSEGERKEENKEDEWTINRGQNWFMKQVCMERDGVIERVCEQHSKSKAN